MRKNCNEEVYETVKKALENYKRVLDFEMLGKHLEKSKKEIEDLNSANTR